jgi:tripartite-type tricarboxylate transporter receptor subunit TctC
MNEEVHMTFVRFVGLGLLLLATWATTAHAQGGADMFKGKTVKVYAGYAPGGGYDLYARILARHIGKHLPGNPSTIVENMPGAGSSRLAAYIHERAPKDGTEFGIIAATVAFDPLLGTDATTAINFDPRTLTWIGSLDQFTPIGIAWKTAGFKSIEDTKKREFVTGSSGGQDGTVVYPTLLNNMIGAKFRCSPATRAPTTSRLRSSAASCPVLSAGIGAA